MRKAADKSASLCKTLTTDFCYLGVKLLPVLKINSGRVSVVGVSSPVPRRL